MSSIRSHEGLGLTIAGAGLALGTAVIEQSGMELPRWLLISLGALAALIFLGGLVLAYKDRGGQKGKNAREEAPSTFAELKGSSGVKISGNVSTADRFIRADGITDLDVRDNLHGTNEQLRQRGDE